MALLSWQDVDPETNKPAGVLKFVEFDATLVEEYSRAVEVTTFPIEVGSPLSDHVQPQQRAITIEVFVSDTPIHKHRPDPKTGKRMATLPPSLTAPKDLTEHLRPHTEPAYGIVSQRLIQSNIERVRTPKQRTASVLQFTGRVTRVVDCFKILDGLIDARNPCTLRILSNREFENMVITNFTTPRTPDNGSGLTFTVDFIEMIPAEVQRSQSKGSQRTPKNNAQKPKADKGVIVLAPFNITASPTASKLERREAEQRAHLASLDQAYRDARNGVF